MYKNAPCFRPAEYMSGICVRKIVKKTAVNLPMLSRTPLSISANFGASGPNFSYFLFKIGVFRTYFLLIFGIFLAFFGPILDLPSPKSDLALELSSIKSNLDLKLPSLKSDLDLDCQMKKVT